MIDWDWAAGIDHPAARQEIQILVGKEECEAGKSSRQQRWVFFFGAWLPQRRSVKKDPRGTEEVAAARRAGENDVSPSLFFFLPPLLLLALPRRLFYQRQRVPFRFVSVSPRRRLLSLRQSLVTRFHSGSPVQDGTREWCLPVCRLPRLGGRAGGYTRTVGGFDSRPWFVACQLSEAKAGWPHVNALLQQLHACNGTRPLLQFFFVSHCCCKVINF